MHDDAELTDIVVFDVPNLFQARDLVARLEDRWPCHAYQEQDVTVVGVFLACVGIFPVDEYFTIHNVVASGMAVIFVVTVIALRVWVPSIPRIFLILGYVYVGVIVVLAIFFVTGYYNLTAVELVAGVLIFSWVIVFLRTMGALRPSR